MLNTNDFEDVLEDDKDGLDNDKNVMEDVSTTIRDIQRGQLTDSSLRTRHYSVDSGVCDLDTSPGPSSPEPELISVPIRGQIHHFRRSYFNEDGKRILLLVAVSDEQAANCSTGDSPRKRKAEDIPQDVSPAKKRGGIRNVLTRNSREVQDKINKSSRKSRYEKAARIQAKVLNEVLELEKLKVVHDTWKLEVIKRDPNYQFQEFQQRPKPVELQSLEEKRGGKRTAKDDQERKAKKRAANNRSKRKRELEIEYDAQVRQDEKSWYFQLVWEYGLWMDDFDAKHPEFYSYQRLSIELHDDVASFLEEASQLITEDL